MLLTETTPVGQIVVEQPGLAGIFERLGLDYCCGGAKPLGQACHEKGIPVGEVLRELSEAAAQASQPAPQWESLAELASQIVERHHDYLRRQLPVLRGQLERVLRAHGARHPELLRLQEVFQAFELDIFEHMDREEGVLFPLIARLELSPESQRTGFSLEGVVQAMEHEHEQAGRDLARMRQITSGYVPPSDACTTYRTLYAGLAELERDMHQHVHTENNILFPAAQNLCA
ncbi:MAG: iron-sulfur cluster repair di-iron protein [Candidatus Eremiobacterota bacterium]